MKQLSLPGLETVELLGLAFEDGSDCCDCEKLYQQAENHPYGIGTAQELFYSCLATSADECPWIERKLNKQNEDELK